jgi:hypothetical protein
MGETIDFVLSPNRDLIAAKPFLRLALSGANSVQPRVINVDGHPAYAPRHRRIKGVGRSQSTLSLPAVTLFEQHHRAGPSLHQEAHHGEFGFPVGGRSMADDRGIRGNAYDPEGADSVVGQRGRGRAAAIHSQPLRDCRVTPRQNFETAVCIAALLFATDPKSKKATVKKVAAKKATAKKTAKAPAQAPKKKLPLSRRHRSGQPLPRAQ